MHELSLCKRILEIVDDHLIGKKGGRVKKIGLEIGRLTGVDHASLLFGFDAVAKGSIAENAVIEIIEVPGEAICEVCHKMIRINNYYDPCNFCGRISLTVNQGEELRVKYMEVE